MLCSKKVLCSRESPFASCVWGAPSRDYLSRAIVDCGGAPNADTAFMGLTSCSSVTIIKTLARPASRWALLIKGFRLVIGES